MPGIPIPSPCAPWPPERGSMVTGTGAGGLHGLRREDVPGPPVLTLTYFLYVYFIVDSIHCVIKCRVIHW